MIALDNRLVLAAIEGADEDGLPDIPVADPSTIPPDVGDHHSSVVLSGTRFNPPGKIKPLTHKQELRARKTVLIACDNLLRHPSEIHYTEGPLRWSGINQHKRAVKGQYPTHADCSATVTWVLWCALHNAFGWNDVVNRLSWRAGWTGSMLHHGRHVTGAKQIGDLVIYNGHVAIYIGGGYVCSHGSEAGPFKLPWRYRNDVVSIRRYF